MKSWSKSNKDNVNSIIFQSDSPGFCDWLLKNKYLHVKQLELIKKERWNVQEEQILKRTQDFDIFISELLRLPQYSWNI